MPAPRLRKVQTRREFESVLDDYMTQGFEVLDQGQRTAMLRKKTWGSTGGHVLWALLTLWWTFGIGNIVYALVAHQTAERVMMKLIEEDRDMGSTARSAEPQIGRPTVRPQ